MGADGRRNRKPLATVKGVDGDRCSAAPALEDVWKITGEVSELPPSRDANDVQPSPTIKIDVRPLQPSSVSAVFVCPFLHISPCRRVAVLAKGRSGWFDRHIRGGRQGPVDQIP